LSHQLAVGVVDEDDDDDVVGTAQAVSSKAGRTRICTAAVQEVALWHSSFIARDSFSLSKLSEICCDLLPKL
jgi:hypothetical protein